VTEYLFAYGTLQPGPAPAEIAAAVAGLRIVGAGRVRGVLYDLGAYLGAVLDAGAPANIKGTVFALPDPAGILSELDAYEEFDPTTPETSLFVRELHAVKLDSGATLMCWIYLYNRDPAGARVLRDSQDG
jgi:gamma-glutamylcyclotransferase (GGCT)/AIG2-like uncharacterized protein YtfP